MSQRNRDDVVVGAKDFSPHSPTPAEALPEGFKMTELGPLPEEWRVVKLGEVAEIKGGKRLPKGHQFSERATQYPYIRVTDFSNGSVDKTNLKFLTKEDHQRLISYTISSRDVYISIAGTIGLVGTIPEDLSGAHLTENAAKIVLTSENISNDFLALALSTPHIQKIIDSFTTKTSQPKLALARIRHIPIPLPPLPEQRAIAHVLRTVQEAQEATERVITALKELKKSLMRHLFSYGPVPLDRTDQVELQETELGPLPAHWQVVRLGEVAGLVRGISWAKEDENPNGVPVISIPNIRNGEVSFDIRYRISKPIPNTKRINDGDMLLVGSSGSVHNVGRIAVVKDLPFKEATFASFMVKVAVTANIYKQYLFYLLESPVVDFPSCSKRAADGKYNLQLTQLSEHKVVLPPLPEQQEIARILQAVDEKIAAEEQRKEVLEGLFKSLLAELMSGRVRLPPAFVSRFVEEKS